MSRSLITFIFATTVILLMGVLGIAACFLGSSYLIADSDTLPVTPPAMVVETAVAATATAIVPSMPTPLPHVQIEHNGITLTYDPALFGHEITQDVPASANRGLFDQPSPAYTRIGFTASDTVYDPAFPWRLTTLEPNIAIYNLHNFGSYAIGDRYTRAQIAEFQQLLDQRPSTITETIPVILPANAGQIIRAQVNLTLAAALACAFSPNTTRRQPPSTMKAWFISFKA